MILDRLRGVDDVEAHFFGHGLVFVEDTALEDPEALFDVAADAQIHAGFVIFHSIAAAQNAAESHFERHAEIER